jgi:hypothetical protein
MVQWGCWLNSDEAAAKRPVLRDDLELKRLMDENGIWTIHGQRYQILGAAITLRRALARAENYGQPGAEVVAISQLLPTRIFIFSDQIARLTD